MNELGKVPPQAIEMEEAVLGAVLLEKNAIYMAAKILTPNSFYKPAHVIIFKTVLGMFANSDPIDLLTVTDKLREQGTLDQIGGRYYITELTTKVNSAGHIEYHATIIKEAWIKRSIIAMASKLYDQCYHSNTDSFVILDNAATQTNNIIEQIYKNKTTDLREVGAEIIETASHNAEGHELVGVPTGIYRVDRFTSGWKTPDLIVIAARPSMGKTAFVLQTALNAATQFGKKIAFFSLEMSVKQCMQRLFSSIAEIDLSKIIKGQATAQEKLILENKGQKIIDSDLYIDDTPALTIIELRAKCHLIKNSTGLDLIIVDYLQLMEAEGKTREQEISKISRGLKAVAKEFNVPVIALSQLSRAVETRGTSKRPQLSDLRESGAIEQDADMVGFLYRPEYYKTKEIVLDGQQISTANLALLIWEKNRNGPLDELPLKFIGKYTKFQDWDTQLVLEPTARPLNFSEPLKNQTHNEPF
jgi:replicative DNA helicase